MNLRDRGSILVLALLVSASSAIAGMWLVLTSDLRSRANRYLSRASDATRNAMSGLELARCALGVDAEWDGATYTLGPSGSIAGSATVSIAPLGFCRVAANSVGALADTTQIVEAELRGPFHPVLDFNVVSATTITFQDAFIDGHVRANGNVAAVGTVDFSGTLETTSGSTVTSEIDSSQVAFVSQSLALPPVSLSELAAMCSPLSGVPFDAGLDALLVDRTRLTPNSNPYGGLNAKGAYVLDADGSKVVLRDLYVQGMILILDAANVEIRKGYFQERVDPSLPSLVVEGNLDLHFEAALVEAAQLFDFNSDGDMLDTFSPHVSGIVRATGSLKLPYTGTVNGAAFGQSVTIVGAASLEDDPQLSTFPVRGYIAPGAWDIVAGTVGDGS